MARFELPIYGKNDEEIKRFETDRVRWGVFMQAIKLKEEVEAKNVSEQFSAISEFMKKIFPDLTDADLENADSDDVFNTFKQLIKKSNAIGSGTASEGVEKNV